MNKIVVNKEGKKKLTLRKVGGIERDIFSDKTHFRFLLHLIRNEGEKKSYPAHLCKELYHIKPGIDITKTSEYNKVVRYIRRWEKAGIIKKSPEKLQHNLSYYIVDYNQITKYFLSILDDNGKVISLYSKLKRLRYKDNEYIIAFLKLYFYLISVESYVFTDLDFTSAVLLLPRVFYEQVFDSILNTVRYNDIYDYAEKEDIPILEKYGIEIDIEEDEKGNWHIVSRSHTDDFDEDKIPKDLKQKLQERRYESIARDFEDNILFNVREGIQKYERKDPKLKNFFLFILIIQEFYHFEYKKDRLKLVTTELTEYVELKFDPTRYEKMSDTGKSWIEQVKDLEKNIDKIHKFRFPY